MRGDRILHGFNAVLYCVNGVLWEAVSHAHGLAVVSIAIAIVSAVVVRKSKE